MRLLIVDDEIKTREGLKTNINWKSIGIDEVFTAADGLDALDQYNRLKHDIVITDIRMPGMDGLALCENIVKQNNNTKIIIISGFSEFEYAKKAMKLGVTDYELKPVDLQGLMNLVSAAREKIAQIKEKEEVELKHQSLYMHDFFEKLLANGVSDKKTKSYLSRYFSFELSEYVICLILDLDNAVETSHPAEENVLSSEVIKSCFARSLNERDFLLYQKTDCQYITLLKTQADIMDSVQKMALKRLKLFTDETVQKYGRTVSFGISDPGRIENMPQLFGQALQSLRHRLYKGDSSLTFFCDIEADKTEVFVPLLNESEIKESVLQLDYQYAESVISKEFEKLKVAKITNSDSVRSVCTLLKNLLVRTINSMNINYYKLFAQNARLIENVPWCETVDEYLKWVLSIYYIVLNGLSDFNNIRHSKLVANAVEYIKLNYTHDITIRELADCVQKTPNYFSHLFKKELGVSFSEFVNRVRVNEAKSLMQDTNLLIYEIAEKVGYKDYDYFKQVFKKIEGYAPSEYRNPKI